MKRFEVSTEIGSLSVTYQKQKKMLVCLSGVGLLPSYENFSLILEKLPPTIGYLTIDFPNTGRSPIHKPHLQDYLDFFQRGHESDSYLSSVNQ